VLQCDQTGARLNLMMIPSLAPLVGAPPIQPQPMMNPYAQSAAPHYTPGPLGYQSPAAIGHQLTDFPVVAVVILQIFTFGIFSFFHFNLMHGKLPKLRMDDPSAGKAIGFMFIPFFNIYWLFFAHLRLIDRINEQRLQAGLPQSNLKGLFITSACLCFIPVVHWICFLVLLPTLCGMLQSSVNELVYRTYGQA
jgi:hypothetical protein